MEERISTQVIRLKPGDDLKKAIQDFVERKNILAGWVISCAGSLTRYCLRFANQEKGSTGTEFYELINLSGTLSVYGSHLHMGISNAEGNMIGGHVLEGCIVYTTAEIVVAESHSLIFTREEDGSTPWKELQIKPR